MNVSTRNKGLLTGGYTFIEMKSQSLSKNLGNSLLGSIVETDLSIMIHFTSFLALWNEGNKSRELSKNGQF